MFFVDHVLFLTVLVTGLVLLITGYFAKKKPPKKINRIYGYRTKRSMKSQEAWDFAQKIAPDHMIRSGLYLIISSLPLYFVKAENDYIIIAIVIIMIVFMILPLYAIERKLKEKFPDV